MTLVAGVVVAITGLWLVGFALSVFVTPGWAQRFLTGFASSARTHVVEQLVRLLAGSALVVFASEMRFAELFRIFGWLLIATSALLLLVPWKWHNRFGEWAIPLAVRYMKLYALGAFALGALILFAVMS